MKSWSLSNQQTNIKTISSTSSNHRSNPQLTSRQSIFKVNSQTKVTIRWKWYHSKNRRELDKSKNTWILLWSTSILIPIWRGSGQSSRTTSSQQRPRWQFWRNTVLRVALLCVNSNKDDYFFIVAKLDHKCINSGSRWKGVRSFWGSDGSKDSIIDVRRRCREC